MSTTTTREVKLPPIRKNGFSHLSIKSKAEIQKAWRARKRSIVLCGRNFSLSSAKNKAYILVRSLDNRNGLPMAQIEKTEYSGSTVVDQMRKEAAARRKKENNG